MDGREKLARLFALQRHYADLFAGYEARGVVQTLDPTDKEFDDIGAATLAHYLSVGADALRLCVQALIDAGRPAPRSILDFPCGSGRVVRHFRAFFPDSRIVACDLYESHVAFCRDTLGAVGALSQENLDTLDFGERFDLIFCGSLLTHLPERLVRAALRLLCRSLSDTGVAVVTTHGRYSTFVQRHRWKYLDDKLFEVAEAGAARTGFGYVAYDHQFGALFHKQSDYGVTLTSPRWLMGALEQAPSVRVLGFTERAWDDHQDLLVFGRPALNE